MGSGEITFRQLMRAVPTPVVVVTAVSDGEARGITIGSFVSVCLEPPLVCFNVMHSSRMHPVLLASGRFAVSCLSESQAAVSARFAQPGLTGAQQFDGIPVHRDASDIPVIDGAYGWMSCRIESVSEAGDHSIVLGQVEELRAGEAAGPLLYWQGDYFRIGDPLRGDT